MLYACDADWWRVYDAQRLEVAPNAEPWTPDRRAAAAHGLNCIPFARDPGLSESDTRINLGLNGGYQAIGLAALFGATRIVLLGFDFQRTGGQSHWHGDHEGRLPNLGNLPRWVSEMEELAAGLRRKGISVSNASRETAIKAFEREPLEQALGDARPLLLKGMHGLGDNLHQRAVVRELMRDRIVWLETPWPQIYHDLVGPRLHLCWKGTTLRKQAQNAGIHRDEYEQAPAIEDQIQMRYPLEAVRKEGSILGAMAAVAGVPVGDFTIPVPTAWRLKGLAALKKVGWEPGEYQGENPLLIYRPLVERREYASAAKRNPDPQAYADLFEAISPDYFVVGVADLVPHVEWVVGQPARLDVAFYEGELDFETLAGIVSFADLVFTAPGFALLLAQAVGTRVVTVFGGHESAASYQRSDDFLAIEPISPCMCFDARHNCNKKIDMGNAFRALKEFTIGSPQLGVDDVGIPEAAGTGERTASEG